MQNEDKTREILNTLRHLNETANEYKDRQLISEEGKKKSKAIPITDDPIFGESVLSSQIDEFRNAVDSGAEFTEPSKDDVASSPLIFMPETKNVVFSGTIPSLNNLKFQLLLRTNTGEGCFIWTDGLILSDANMETLHKIQGFYKNWKNEWNQMGGDLDRMAKALR